MCIRDSFKLRTYEAILRARAVEQPCHLCRDSLGCSPRRRAYDELKRHSVDCLFRGLGDSVSNCSWSSALNDHTVTTSSQRSLHPNGYVLEQL
eukprot:6655083-Alexandrium_andersonii.AAC.1